MNRKTLKLHKVKIVKLTQRTTIKGGTDDTMIECPDYVTINTCAPDGTCTNFTDDKKNGNNTVPTFVITVCVGFSVYC